MFGQYSLFTMYQHNFTQRIMQTIYVTQSVLIVSIGSSTLAFLKSRFKCISNQLVPRLHFQLCKKKSGGRILILLQLSTSIVTHRNPYVDQSSISSDNGNISFQYACFGKKISVSLCIYPNKRIKHFSPEVLLLQSQFAWYFYHYTLTPEKFFT